MKKGLLLGLLALSAVTMANPTDTTKVDVVTDLTLTGNGIIITPEEDGVESASILLPHGVKANPVDSTSDPASAFIKTATGNLPPGMNIRIDLDQDTVNANDLSINGTGSSSAEKIAHTLTGTIVNGQTTNNKLEISGTTANSNSTVRTTGDALAVNFLSNIKQADMTGKLTGTYKNTSTLSVTVLAN